jgi:Xaa-Pro aminopeptidase
MKSFSRQMGLVNSEVDRRAEFLGMPRDRRIWSFVSMTRISKIEIPAAEFEQRRDSAVRLAREAGLAGLLVCSRGGAALDRYGDVMYLANHYTSFPYIPDLPGAWTGRAHSFMVMPVGDAPVLIADIPSIEAVKLPRDQIVLADLVTEAVIDVMRKSLPKGRVGLVGGDTLPVSLAKQFEAALPAIEWVPADNILAQLRSMKSPPEIAKLRAAAQLGSRMIEAMMAAAVPGATHGDVVAAGMAVLVPAGGMLYNSFMASGRGGENPTMSRCNFPTWGSPTPLSKGDWLRLGISGVLDGYCFDVSRSRAIGSPTNAQVAAFEAAIAVVEEGIAAIQPGNTAGGVAEAGLRKQTELGFTYKGVFSGLGHGIGLGWDSPWLVPGEPTVLKPSMVLNVEKTLMKDGYLGDFEETVVLTERGPQLLTDAQLRFW